MAEKILVAYYTWSGNTGRIAHAIHRATGGTLFEIRPEAPYPSEYGAVVDQAQKEIGAGFRPALAENLDDIDSWDTLFIGTPNWWSTMAPPVAAFLAGKALAGKTVAPFVSHGGGGLARCASDIAAACPGAKLLPAYDMYGASGDLTAKVSAWLDSIGMGK